MNENDKRAIYEFFNSLAETINNQTPDERKKSDKRMQEIRFDTIQYINEIEGNQRRNIAD